MTEAVITPDAGAEPVVTTAETSSSDDGIMKALADHGITDSPNGNGADVRDEPAAEKPEKPADKPEAKAEPKAEPKAEKEPAKRAEDGKFATKDPNAEPEAPKARVAAPDRFNDLAKTDWDKTPEPVQAEVARMHRELEKGLTEYKAREEPIRQYREMAEKVGVKFEDALSNYVAAEKALHENPMQALAQMAAQYVPGGLEAFARALTGQTQPQDRSAQENHALRQELAQLRQMVQQSTQTVEQQAQERAAAERQAIVDQFAAANPRATEPEVEAEMTRLLTTGYISRDLPPNERLSQAYEAATRLIPAPAQEPAPQVEPAQTRVTTSITGAPRSGSNPQRAEPASTEDAIWSAMKRHRIA